MGFQPPIGARCKECSDRVARATTPPATFTIWLFNIAMENPSSMEVLNGFNGKSIYKWAIFHGYVK
jgi:hypothetical protein